MNRDMTEAAKEQRRAYKREWQAKNRDKTREYNRKYWEKKASQEMTDFYAEDPDVVAAFSGRELMFTIFECVESGDGFVKGCLYASIGTNNGIQVIRENEKYDAEVYEYQTSEHPAEAWDGSGKPSFRTVINGRRRV